MEQGLSSRAVLDRLGHEELKLKQLGLVNHAAGVRTAIVAVLKLIHEGPPEPSPLDSSPSD
jgi:hypothetical protein